LEKYKSPDNVQILAKTDSSRRWNITVWYQ
jgi:hypothetical protein